MDYQKILKVYDIIYLKYQFEVIMVCLVIINILQYLIGKYQNQNKIIKWLKNVKHIFDNQFAHLGTTCVNNTGFFDEISKSQYIFYCSGRINCNFMQVTHNLKKRQDLFSLLFLEPFNNNCDQLVYDIAVDSDQMIVFGIVHKKIHKNEYKDNVDLNNLGNKYNNDQLINHVIFAENQETVDYFVDESLIQILNKYPSIQKIFMSDQKSIMNHKLSLRIVVNYSENYEEIMNINKMIFNILDKMPGLNLSSGNKIIAQKEREIIDEMNSKEKKMKIQEELNQKKLEKKMKEEELLRRTNPEKLKRLEEREKKNEIKKRFKSKVVKM